VRTGYLKRVQAGVTELLLLTERDDVEGKVTPPSQRQGRPGVLRDVRWPVQAGARTISIDVKAPAGSGTDLARLIVKANPEVGLGTDLVGIAPVGTGWVTIGPLSFTATAIGVLEVWRERRDDMMDAELYWDNLQVT
jgi:hypothetical protein